MSKDNYILSSGALSDLSTTIISQLEIPKMQGMTGNSLILHRTVSKSKKKKQTKLLLVAVILVAVMVIAVVALMYLGLI